MRTMILLACLLLTACGQQPPAERTAALVQAAPKGDPVEGARIARRVGCDGCHAEGGKGGGFDVKTPEGDRVVAPNLTQRRTLYDDAALVALLRQGKTHDGHPPFGMPIKMLQHLSDRETHDIVAWVRALPTIENPGLAETRITPSTMKGLLDGTHPYAGDEKPDPDNAPPAERPVEPLALGKYLAYTTCSECHGWDLNGFDGDDAPPLIVAKAYTPAQFTHLLRTGEVAAGGKSKTGFMSEVATYRFANTLTEAEIGALKRYLDSR